MQFAGTQRVNDGPALDVAGLVHRVRRPRESGPHPAAILLHGRGGDEDVMWVFASALPRNWLIVAPRGLQPDPDGRYTWLPRRRDGWPSLEAFDDAVAAVVRFIRALPDLYSADLERVYAMGFSQGAALAYAAAMRHHRLAKGIAGLVGFTPENAEAVAERAPLKDVPVFMAAGLEDPLVPIERSRASADVLRRAGASLEYHEYPTGHRLSADGVRDLKRWWRQWA
jgi:phospholipase/carboxylesterase